MHWLYGAGGIGVVALDILLENNCSSLGLIDETLANSEVRGIEIRKFGTLNSYDESDQFTVCISNVKIRESLCGLFHGRLKSVFHKSSIVSPNSTFASGVLGFHGSKVQTGTSIGIGVILNTGASVDHDCTVGDFSHIGPNATVCGYVKIGIGSYIGANATILPGLVIGDGVMVGAGAVVTKNVESGQVVAGVPARIVKK